MGFFETLFDLGVLAPESLFVEGEIGEGFGLVAEFCGGGEGQAEVIVFGSAVATAFGRAEHLDVVLDGRDAHDAPSGIGEKLDEFLFFRSLGFVSVAEVLAMGFELGQLFGGENEDLAGESVTMGVQASAPLAVVGFGAGGVLGICPVDFGSVGFGLGQSWLHLVNLPFGSLFALRPLRAMRDGSGNQPKPIDWKGETNICDVCDRCAVR